MSAIELHLVDGTYELFRHHFGAPQREGPSGQPTGAVVGVLRSLAGMIQYGARHVGVATDHVVESFRNDMYAGYKTSEGLEPVVMSQFPLLEDALQLAGFVVWPMIEHEADDALATAAVIGASHQEVEKIFLCTADKDLAQSVVGTRIVQLDRRRREVRDEDGVKAKFGVGPSLMVDWLALVGDASDGYPGIRGFGPATAAAVLTHFGPIESIPPDGWKLAVRGPERLSKTLRESMADALLFKDLATLRTNVELQASPQHLRWIGPTEGFARFCEATLGDKSMPETFDIASRSVETSS